MTIKQDDDKQMKKGYAHCSGYGLIFTAPKAVTSSRFGLVRPATGILGSGFLKGKQQLIRSGETFSSPLPPPSPTDRYNVSAVGAPLRMQLSRNALIAEQPSEGLRRRRRRRKCSRSPYPIAVKSQEEHHIIPTVKSKRHRQLRNCFVVWKIVTARLINEVNYVT